MPKGSLPLPPQNAHVAVVLFFSMVITAIRPPFTVTVQPTAENAEIAEADRG
ncbi:MAG: hypothetical protein NUV74_10660 [Candidatus Brocadiaceae bacterium]|nr:hypothetical protein [Candidatus Brocadiaceae bacterium]